MRRLVTFILTATVILGGASVAFAQSNANINAGLTTDIWLSPVNATEGDTVTLFTGFWDQTANTISGSVVFYVDSIKAGTSDFTASPASLVQVSYPWTAVSGDHVVSAQIVTLNGDLSLTSLTNAHSSTTTFVVLAKPVVPATSASSVISSIASSTLSVVSNTVTAINTQANTLANDLDQQATLAQGTGSQPSIGGQGGQVLGTSTEDIRTVNNNGTSSSTSSFNILPYTYSTLAFLLRHWLFVLIVLAILVIIFCLM